MICKKCGEKNINKAIYCKYCGHKFTKKEKENIKKSRTLRFLEKMGEIGKKPLIRVINSIPFKVLILILIFGFIYYFSILNKTTLLILKSNDYSVK